MILGVTPARGGSKGIPRKNIRVIAGKPLIAWTIEAAVQSKLLNRYIVSTEDEEISRIVRQYQTDVLPRPDELSTDETPTLAVLQHVVEQIPCDIVVLLQATSPVRKPGLIDECISLFLDKEYDSLASGFMCKFVEYGKNELRRQDIKGFFCDDGNVYIIKADLIKNGDRHGDKIGRKIISRWENVEIDDEIDFWIAENILQRSVLK
jgi:CMP-N-acetylneuraminic acid synthetase